MKSFLQYVCLSLVVMTAWVHAAVPQMLNHQGRIAVSGVNFEGAGQFKFALVNGAGTISYWSNDGTSAAGSEPTAAVSLSVTKGLYSVLLGDTAVANMTALPPTVFDNADVRLRVWFNDGVNGFEQITPDHRLAAAAWAIQAGQADLATTVPDGSITSAKIAAGAVGSTELAPGLISTPQSILGTTQTAVANAGYLAVNAALTTVTLPTTAEIGDVVNITGVGAGGWVIQGYDPILWTPHESVRQWRAIASSADGSTLVATTSSSSPIYVSTDFGQTWTPGPINRLWNGIACSADGATLVATAYNDTVYLSTDSGATWNSTPGSGTRSWGRIACSADGTHLLACVSPGKLYTSTDTGVTWTERESDRQWSSVATSADGSALVATVFNGQIYTSADSGVSWTARETSRRWESVASSADGSKLVAVEDSPGQIYTSSDYGVSWTPRETDQLWASVASSADGNRLVAVGGGPNNTELGPFGGRIFVSSDSGVTWVAQEEPRNWTAVASSADGLKLAAAARSEANPQLIPENFAGGRIFTAQQRASDYYVDIAAGAQGTYATVQYLGDGHWATIAPVASGALFSPKTISGTTQVAATNTSYVTLSDTVTTVELPASGQVGDLVQITGAGTGGWSITGFVADSSVWTPREAVRYWEDLASSADGRYLIANVAGGMLYTSSDFGVTWTARESVRDWSSVASSADGSKLVASAYAEQLYTSTDFGVTWTASETVRNWSGVASSADGAKLVAVENGGKIYTSTNYGATWVPRESNRNWYRVASSADGSIMVTGDYVGTGSGGFLYVSTDSGATWTPRGIEGDWTDFASSADGTKLVAVDYTGTGSGGRIYTSTDSGVTWTARESERFWYSVTSSADGTKLAAADSDLGKIYTSTDSGVTWTPQDSDRYWEAVTSSADGDRLAAAEYNGLIYTSGSTGEVAAGAAGSTATFQLLPNGQWAPVGGQGEIAAGYETGTGSVLAVQGVSGNSITFDSAFSESFAESPTVSLGSGWTVDSTSVSGFTATAGFVPLTVDSAGDVGKDASLAVINGRPAISYRDDSDGDLMFVRAVDASGASWPSSSITRVDGALFDVGSFSSLAQVDGRPAIAYYDSSHGDLCFIRANDAGGVTWPASAIRIDGETSNVGREVSLAVIGGVPAISYQSPNTGEILYAWAADAAGTSWPAANRIAVEGSLAAYRIDSSLAEVGGKPAIAIYNQTDGDLRYAWLSGSDPSLIGDWSVVDVDTTGNVGKSPSLVVIDGYPAIAYDDVGLGEVKFVRAADALGATWNAAISVASGKEGSLAFIGGVPMISFYAIATGDLQLALAADTSGTTWPVGSILTVDGALANVGSQSSLVTVAGLPAMAYRDSSTSDLKYATLPAATWSASTGAAEPILASGVKDGGVTGAMLSADLGFWQRSGDDLFYSNGRIGIGRLSTANALEVEGNASKTTAGSWLANSDRRIKANVRELDGALEKIMALRLVDFEYTAEYRAEHPSIDGRRFPNVIAQEFAEVFPDWVQTSGEPLPDGHDEIQQVDTYPIMIYSAAAVQELQRENEALKAKLSDQEQRLRKLEATLNP